jgi:hypothetical protein
MELNNKKFSIFSTILLLFSGCSADDCGFPLDQVRYTDKIQDEKITYYLFTRTTGWHDKVIIFELYDAEPQFDKCRQTKTSLIYRIVYDDYPVEQYVKKLKFQPDQTEKLKITYTTDISEGIKNIYDVRFTHK